MPAEVTFRDVKSLVVIIARHCTRVQKARLRVFLARACPSQARTKAKQTSVRTWLKTATAAGRSVLASQAVYKHV